MSYGIEEEGRFFLIVNVGIHDAFASGRRLLGRFGNFNPKRGLFSIVKFFMLEADFVYRTETTGIELVGIRVKSGFKFNMECFSFSKTTFIFIPSIGKV